MCEREKEGGGEEEREEKRSQPNFKVFLPLPLPLFSNSRRDLLLLLLVSPNAIAGRQAANLLFLPAPSLAIQAKRRRLGESRWDGLSPPPFLSGCEKWPLFSAPKRGDPSSGSQPSSLNDQERREEERARNERKKERDVSPLSPPASLLLRAKKPPHYQHNSMERF